MLPCLLQLLAAGCLHPSSPCLPPRVATFPLCLHLAFVSGRQTQGSGPTLLQCDLLSTQSHQYPNKVEFTGTQVRTSACVWGHSSTHSRRAAWIPRDSAPQADRLFCVQLNVQAAHQAGGVASSGQEAGRDGHLGGGGPVPALPPSAMLMKVKKLQLPFAQGCSVLGPGKTQAVLVSVTAGVHRDGTNGLVPPHPSWDRCVPFPVHPRIGMRWVPVPSTLVSPALGVP